MLPLFRKCKSFTLPDEYRAKGIYPYFHELESRQDTEVIMEGKRRIMLGSNNYLGLTVDPRVVKAADDAVLKYGTGCSGSRFLNGTLDLHTQLEKEPADAAITYSTTRKTTQASTTDASSAMRRPCASAIPIWKTLKDSSLPYRRTPASLS